ncbi:hypothetical protein [Lactococcus cremoris]|uniref:hypothetical protein n=1 Tax=Lactococcus lactis subsp. cremoris TaxID=1359 RepID=UPI0021823FD4|nr:hypothetical protein [Lactococcus cremoris]MCT0477918.1 hypothetical protein [Lactococcus cremoris]
MSKKFVDNDSGAMSYQDKTEPHVKNTIHNEIKDILIEIANLKERILKIESKMDSQEDFERKYNEKSTKRISIITAVITLLVGLPGIFSLIIQLTSKH